jgi:NAD-dependent deacetylase
VAKRKLLVFSGAGISAESGLKTFRDSDGLWENYSIEDVATPEAWFKNPKLVLTFYAMRYQQCMAAIPNAAHLHLAELEKTWDVQIITQNIDDLHERAGSKKVLHLHGEIKRVKSDHFQDQYHRYIEKEEYIQWGDLSPEGHQLRPDIVWFGEMVPKMDEAIMFMQEADVFLVIGTSLQVYPAANLVNDAPKHAEKFIIDPQAFAHHQLRGFKHIQKTAVQGMTELLQMLQ